MMRAFALLAMTMGCGAAGAPTGGGEAGDARGGGGADAGGPHPTADASEPNTDPAEYVSGTRIRRRMGSTPDGAKMFLGWRDTMLGVDCYFATSSDGKLRCLPSTSAAIGSLYSDMACVTEVAYVGCAGAATPPYALKSAVPACGQPYTSAVYSVGALYSGAIYIKSGVQCVAYPGGTPAYTFFTVGALVAATAFQSMSEALE